MKKLLALVLTLAMVLGTFGYAAAVPADVVGTEYEEAATKLGALGVMIGDDAGFRPNDAITRAEFSVLVVRALGLEAAAKFSTSPTKFADVTDAYSWAWGYINVAVEQGVIKGYSETAFGPGDPVTYEQAITMIVRALGYEPAVVGGYPAGYLAKAAELDITDDVTVVTGAGAPRGAVAQMLANALEVDLMERKSFGDEAVYETVNKTLLEDKIGVEVIEGTVKSVNMEDSKLRIDTTQYTAAEGVLVQGLEDAEVVAWKLDKKIVYIELDSSVVFDYIEAVDAAEKTVDLKLADDTFEYDMAAAPSLGFAKIVMDDDDVIVKVDTYVINLRGFVDEVNEDSEYVDYVNPAGDVRKLRYDEDDVQVVIDGKLARVADIEEGSLLFSTADATVLVVSTEVIEGEFARSRDKEVNIDGKYYDAEAHSARYYSTDGGEEYERGDTDMLNDLLGEDVVAYVDYKGDVLFIAGDVEESTTEVIVLAYTDARVVGFDKQFKALTSTGEKVTYTLDDDKLVVNADTIYKLELDEDGYVTDVEELVVLGAGNDVKAVDDKKDTIKVDEGGSDKVYYVTGSTVFFNVEDYLADGGAGKGDIDDVTVVDWADIEDADYLLGFKVIVKANSKSNARAVAITDGYDSISSEDVYFAYVTAAPAAVSKDEVELKLDNGVETVYVVFDKDDVDNAGVVKENIVAYKLNSAGDGTKIEVVKSGNSYYVEGVVVEVDGAYVSLISSACFVLTILLYP
jgi:hypothetical protein